MLHRLLLGLLAMASLTLAGCVHSPQQLSPQPVLNTQLAAVGRGQPVVVRVVDGRPSPVLGTRGGMYPETSAIVVRGQDILPKLQAQAEAAEAAKKKADEEKLAKAKADNCTRARQAKAAFDSGKPITQSNAQGERIFLDEAGRAAESKRIDGIIAADCKR